MSEVQFSPGALIQARGREWMVLGQVDEDTIHSRPRTHQNWNSLPYENRCEMV